MRRSTLAVGLLILSMMATAQQAPPPSDDSAGPPDEPGRPVARLSVVSGDASVRRGDSGDWVAAALNAPLMVGDSVSVAPSSAAEIQLDASNFARLAGDSEVRISEFETGRYQLQLVKGLVTYRVLRPYNGQIEIATPLAAVHPIGLASVRIEVAPDYTTRVVVRHGEAEVTTRRGGERVREGNMMLIKGSTDDPEFQVVYAQGVDQWDNWSDQRDAYLTRAQSPKYVSPDIYGTEDLDSYGRWSNDPTYGDVWTPTVDASWAPYRDGRWCWEDYYGWTWVDASPWGWAPFHYGSWYFRTGFGWSWFPGHRYERFWYRPALVGFFGFGGGGGFGLGFGNVGWIPLAPYERFHPWYGRGGWGNGRNAAFTNINIVRNTNITNVYRNARFANGVTAVSGSDFQRGNFRNRMSVGSGQLQQASLVRGAVPFTPGADHLRFSDRSQTVSGPRVDPGNQRFFSRMPASSSASQRVPFTRQQSAVRSAFESRGMQFGAGANTGASAEPGRRFGSGGNPAGAREAAPSSPGWQRFGSPQAPGAQRNGFAQTPGNGNESRVGGQSRSLEVAPPIVRERQNAPSGNAASGNGRWQAPAGGQSGAPSYRQQQQPAYNRPQYSQPQYRQSQYNRQAAPQQQQSRSGGFGAPSYRSAPSAPQQRSAPAPRSNGGGGGGHVGGGGNFGGHGGRR